MYNDYYGFSESPFNITPNSRFYHRTQSCDEVLQVVRHGIETRKGLIVIVGEPGSGKTLFLQFLVRDLTPRVKTVIVPNPYANLDEMLRLLAERLDLAGAVEDRTARLDQLTDHLIAQRRQDRIVCLLIDEAQDLDANTLDDLRVLANLEYEGDALLPIVLVGQPELNLKLDHPSATRIKQRVALTRTIYPLIRKEVGPYIDSRLKVAGYEKSGLFDAEAVDMIAAHSAGIPRMVNSLCDNALFKAFTMKQSVISAPIVDQVARELRVIAPLALPKQLPRAAAEPTPMRTTESFTRRAEEPSVELFEVENRLAGALHRSSDFHVLGSPDDISREPDMIRDAGAEMAPKNAPDARQGKLSPFQARTHILSILSSLFSVRMGWYAFAGTIVLLLLALNIVNSSQLTGIYSALSGKTPTAVADPQLDRELDGVKSDRTSVAQSDRRTTKREQPGGAISDRGNEINGDNTASTANSKPAPPMDPPTALPATSFRQAQPEETTPAVKKNDSKPASVTLEVVKRSKVRAKPSDGSEIIAELEPGNRVSVLAKSRDYYHVRSLDDKSIRGYVHREDAFFESTKRR
jgi:general secretion pathway protein A